MAKDKKSFILYSDIYTIVDDLPREIKGDLFQLIVDYVNDRNPQPTDLLLKTAFNPIKQQLKRDLVKWEEIRGKRSSAGKASAESKKQKQQTSTSVESVEQTSTKSTVSVNDNVNVNVIVNDYDKKDTFNAFGKRLFESELEINAIEISTKRKVTKDIVKAFNANCINQSKSHSHYSEWKKHLSYWLNKQPAETKKYEKYVRPETNAE